MTDTCCLVCGNSQSKDSDASFHRFPSDLGRRAIWLRVFDSQESDIKPHHRVCSRHFPNGDARSDPIATLGKRFASPIKKGPRAKRAKGRQTKKQLSELYSSVSPTPSSSRSVTPSTFEQPSLTAPVGEQLVSDYQVHELPVATDGDTGPQAHQTEVLVKTALLARIEYLEAENAKLRKECSPTTSYFRIEQVKHDDSLVKFYTGFITYQIFLAFFHFLGPVVHKLNYWGSKEGACVRNRPRKLDAEN